MKRELEQRWGSDVGQEFVRVLLKHGRSGNGYSLEHSPFGRVEESGRLDLRGLILPETYDLRNVTMKDVDLSGAVLNRTWMERCTVVNSSFNHVSFNDSTEHGSTFEGCSFERTRFERATLGYRGSRFMRCSFVRANFRWASFVRPEFDHCLFDGCTLVKLDFNGASFERVAFRGTLRDVWFRGGFPLNDMENDYGTPRPNKMTAVDFREAKVSDLTFSDGCDLSTIIPPEAGEYVVFDRWRERLEALAASSQDWPENQKKDAQLFASLYLTHAQNQNWYLIGLEEVTKRYGTENGMQIWKCLQEALLRT